MRIANEIIRNFKKTFDILVIFVGKRLVGHFPLITILMVFAL